VATPAGDEVVIPALLRAARGAYQQAIGRRLRDAGFDDLPRNGPFVVGGMARAGGSAGHLVRHLGVSQQAAGQLIDTLVERGYLARRVNPTDRRRITVELTDRGRAAAAAVREGIVEVDDALTEMISVDQLAGLRAGLGALAELRWRQEAPS
jgi:DNA-binding MarR family transcriptional regulator